MLLAVSVVDAQHNDCHLQLRKVPAQGYTVDAIKAASKEARLAFAYHGVLWENHPTLRATISEIWSRFNWHLKIDEFLVASGFGCIKGSVSYRCITLAKNR